SMPSGMTIVNSGALTVTVIGTAAEVGVASGAGEGARAGDVLGSEGCGFSGAGVGSVPSGGVSTCAPVLGWGSCPVSPDRESVGCGSFACGVCVSPGAGDGHTIGAAVSIAPSARLLGHSINANNNADITVSVLFIVLAPHIHPLRFIPQSV
ncbi:MAG TPA: hypothetical protein PKB13_10995, partial [Clostridia bacterium]|nr:hypothetical protein [Clostridia bacterium]